MRLEIERKGSLLPFVSPIPSHGIGHLEGYNGVGKSLTVSVFELCAGRRPRMEEQEWIGFCEGIGLLEVHARELDGQDIKWVLDGKTLLEASKDAASDARPELDWFVDVTVGGDPARSLEAIKSQFDVERVNGDVGLIEQLAVTAETEGSKLQALEDRLLGSQKLDQVEQKIGDLVALLGELSVERIANRGQLAKDLADKVVAAKAELDEAGIHTERVEQAAQLQTRLEEISAVSGDLEAEIADLTELIQSDEAVRKDIVGEIEAAEEAAAASKEVREELEKATRNYKAASTRLRNLSRDLAKAGQVANIDDDDDTAPRRAELEERINRLEARRLEVDAGPAVVKVIDEVSPPIAHAAATDLGTQPLLSAPSRAPTTWSVSDVAKALAQRREELDAIPASREATQVAEEIETAKEEKAALAEIDKLRQQRVKARERLEESQKKSASLTEKLDQAASSYLDDLRTKRKALDERLSTRAGERAVATYRLDALGPRDQRTSLVERLAKLLKELGVDEAGLEAALAEALELSAQKREHYIEVREDAQAAAGDHERDLAEIARTLEILKTDAASGWLARPIPAADAALKDRLEFVAELQFAASHADSRLDVFRQSISGLRASLLAGADELRGRDARAEIQLPKVIEWLERDAIRWFDDEDFRVALLGERAEKVSIDLRTRLVSWEANGSLHTKPIEALSSGERAFAFTQAKLALLQQGPQSSQNRLIALDEFGAFVSSNRIRQLATYLQRWRDSHPSDQILIILPANQDYQALARGADGDAAKRYLRMANALSEQGWFVEEFLVA